MIRFNEFITEGASARNHKKLRNIGRYIIDGVKVIFNEDDVTLFNCGFHSTNDFQNYKALITIRVVYDSTPFLLKFTILSLKDNNDSPKTEITLGGVKNLGELDFISVDPIEATRYEELVENKKDLESHKSLSSAIKSTKNIIDDWIPRKSRREFEDSQNFDDEDDRGF